MSEVSCIQRGLYSTRCPTSDQRHARCPVSVCHEDLIAANLPTFCRNSIIDYSGYAAVCLAIFVIGSGMRTRLGRPDLVSVTSTKTRSSPITIGSLTTSNCSPYIFIWFPGVKPNPFSLLQSLTCCSSIYEIPVFFADLRFIEVGKKGNDCSTANYRLSTCTVVLCLHSREPAVIECSESPNQERQFNRPVTLGA